MALDAITPLILTYNEAPNISRTLDKLSWAQRILVIDSGSTDGTIEIVRNYPQAEIVHHAFRDFEDQWNYGLTLVESPWVLSLDADYELGEALVEELQGLRPPEDVAGFSARFVYRIHGKPLRGSLYPPRIVLFRKDRAVYRMDGHTQRLAARGRVLPLAGVIYHDDRKPLARWIASQQRYARDEVAYLFSRRSERLGLADGLRLMGWPAPVAVFLYTLLVKRCLFDGRAGWYYALQRVVAEALLALEIMDRQRGGTSPDRMEIPEVANRVCAGTNISDREVTAMVYTEAKRSFPRRYQIADCDGQKIEVPVAEEDDDRYFVMDQTEEIRKYYAENGYVVLRHLLPQDLCDRANELFTTEVKPFRGYIYRQASGNPERHVFTNEGFILNSILNIQSLDGRHFAGFRRAGLDLLTHAHMGRAVATILGEPGKLVQSMYFEGNPVTWPHQDTYYLDAEEIGRMTAAWVATEDIAPGAGRFFVYPKSHLIDMTKNGGNFDIAFHHERYKELVKRVIREQGVICRAPALSKGDVLFWAAKTIHGSLRTTEPRRSRRSFTVHFIPDRSRFLQYQTRVRPLEIELVDGMKVHHPKDLSKPANRAIFFVETRFPRTFQMTKRAAIKLVTR